MASRQERQTLQGQRKPKSNKNISYSVRLNPYMKPRARYIEKRFPHQPTSRTKAHNEVVHSEYGMLGP